MKATLFVKKKESEINFRHTSPCSVKTIKREDGSVELRIHYTRGKMISVLLNEVECRSVSKMLTGVMPTMYVDNYQGINDSPLPLIQTREFSELSPEADEPAQKIEILIESKMNYNPDIREFMEGDEKLN